jgi:uncharacterized protein (TIGR02145 family)
MKAIAGQFNRSIHGWLRVIIRLAVPGLLFILPACQKYDDIISNKETITPLEIIPACKSPVVTTVLYYGHVIFKRNYGAPIVEKRLIENPDYEKFNNDFILKIRSGENKRGRVSSADIRIDGVLIVGPSSFNKKVCVISKRITLKPTSVLEVKINGTPGSQIDLWIEGTLKENVITDIDNNKYFSVQIGDQVWMAENLRTTRYNNGDIIETTTPASLDISQESEPKYQWPYEGNEGNVSVYGRLYTWYTVTDSRGVCPTGWHVPTDPDWTTLTDFLTNNNYGYGNSGIDIAKSLASKSGWKIDATPGNVGNDQTNNDLSNFDALPGGYRFADGLFYSAGIASVWLSSTESKAINVWYRGIYYNISVVIRADINKKFGGYIRCVKD